MKFLRNNRYIQIIRYNKVEFICLFLIISLLFLLIDSLIIDYNIDKDIKQLKVKERIYKNLLTPDYSNIASDEKIEKSREIVKHRNKLDTFTINVLGFEDINDEISYSKKKTNSEMNLDKAKFLVDHWKDDKWWAENSKDYSGYLFN